MDNIDYNQEFDEIKSDEHKPGELQMALDRLFGRGQSTSMREVMKQAHRKLTSKEAKARKHKRKQARAQRRK